MPSPVSISKTDESIETMFVKFLCESMTPFGCPVVPDVKMREATAFGETFAGSSAIRSSSDCSSVSSKTSL
jgi:hypothetical protein